MIRNEKVRDAIYKSMSFQGNQVRFCKHCEGKHTGKGFIDRRKSVPSIDGKEAFQVFWMCGNDWHHFHKLGYTRPVDFNLIYGTPEQPKEDGAPENDASDKVWEDWAKERFEKIKIANKL